MMSVSCRFKKLFLSAVFAYACFYVKAQLTVSRAAPYNSVNYLINNLFLGNSMTVSNITYSGVDTAIGFFNGVASNIGLDSGIILCNGTITNAPGPNNTSSATYSWTNCTTYSDPDLALLASATINDAAVIQFDFVAPSDTLNFQYVFGSEEYPEFVGSFNDAFGFFISGPGISGPYTGNAANIAVIPGTATPVTINNVNCSTNSAYYVCNWPGACNVSCPTSSNMPSTTVQYDGFTVVLTAIAVLQSGQTYHIKLAVGDAGDCAYDSGVFLKANSFSFVLPIELLSFTAVYDNDANIVKLKWVSATEKNNALYTVQRSVDGINFTDVTSMPGAGNSDVTKYYAAIDPDILGGIVYYRLKQTDYDGHFTYSQTDAVNEGESGGDVIIVPNPANSSVNVEYGAPGTGEKDEIKMYDCTGRLVIDKTVMSEKGVNKVTLNISALHKGVYIIRIDTPFKTYFKKSIKD